MERTQLVIASGLAMENFGAKPKINTGENNN
jgi:hypothetical protein